MPQPAIQGSHIVDQLIAERFESTRAGWSTCLKAGGC